MTAREKAKEELASHERCSDPECSVCVTRLAEALRALLAETEGQAKNVCEPPTPDSLTSDEPIHAAFGLSYASYLVVPRTVLQSMSVAWQAKFVALMNETHERFPGWEPPWPQGWTVHLRGEKGRFIEDDLARYERGRRQLEPGKPARPGVDTWPDGGATP